MCVCASTRTTFSLCEPHASTGARDAIAFPNDEVDMPNVKTA